VPPSSNLIGVKLLPQKPTQLCGLICESDRDADEEH
jgi:hypothetical protein